MWGHDAQHTNRSPYVGPQQGTVAWKVFLGWGAGSPVTIGVDGNVYAGASQNLTAIRIHNNYDIHPTRKISYHPHSAFEG